MGFGKLVAGGSLLVGGLAGAACHRQPELDSLKAEIVALHRRDIANHLAGNAAALAAPTSPDYISVANGEVEAMDGTEMEHRLSAYLAATEFSHYQDTAQPIVGVSDDGSLAWAVFRVWVAGTRSLEGGSSRSYDTQWAWMTLYERSGDGWLRVADVSTNRPFEDGRR